MNRLIRFILDYPKSGLALVLFLSLGVASFAPRMKFDASIKAFILEDDPDYAYFLRYREMFGQDEILAIAFEDEEIFEPGNLAFIRKLTERIEDIENVYDVRSLTNVEYMESSEESFEVVALVPDDIPTDAPSLAKIKQKALNNVIYSQDLISPDSKKTSIVVTLASMNAGYKYHDEVLAIERIVKEEAKRTGKSLFLTGERFLDFRILQYIHRDLQTFLPITLIALAVLLFIMFGNVRETIIGLLAVVACLMWVGGLIPLTGWEMNAVTAGLPSLVLCIAVTDVIHIVHKHREALGETEDTRKALEKALRDVAMPCFLTSLTTAIGFGSLTLNEVHPIRGFGLLASLGVGLCFPVCIVVVSSMLLIWKSGRPSAKAQGRMRSAVSGYLGSWAAFLAGSRGRSFAVLSVLCLIILLGVAGVEIQVDRTRYLKQSSDVHQSIDFIDRNLAGTTQIDVAVDTGVEGNIKEPWVLAQLEDFAQYLRAQPEIDKVLFINDFIKDMNQAFNTDDPAYYRIPQTRGEVAELLLIYSLSGNRNELNKYVDYPYSRTRMSIRTSEQSSARVDALIAGMKDYIGTQFDKRLDVRIGSSALANNNVFHYLVEGLLIGLGTAVLVVALVMCLAFRSWFAGVVSIIPNVVPVIACLGLMGICGIYLDIATAMTFSIALGIAVDDTIHLLSRFRLERARMESDEKALRAAMMGVGPALMRTTIVIVGGFLIFSFASLKMNVTFGLLSAFIIFVTLLADLTVTPLCLLVFRPFREEAEPGRAEGQVIGQPALECEGT